MTVPKLRDLASLAVASAPGCPYIAFVKDSLAVGLTRTQTYVTTHAMRARQLDADVFSTPSMISLMERTCTELTEPHLSENEQTVGTHVDIRHFAPTKIGQSVTVHAEITAVNGSKISYQVNAKNDNGIAIGAGTHRRAVIDVKQFAL